MSIEHFQCGCDVRHQHRFNTPVWHFNFVLAWLNSLKYHQEKNQWEDGLFSFQFSFFSGTCGLYLTVDGRGVNMQQTPASVHGGQLNQLSDHGSNIPSSNISNLNSEHKLLSSCDWKASKHSEWRQTWHDFKSKRDNSKNCDSSVQFRLVTGGKM